MALRLRRSGPLSVPDSLRSSATSRAGCARRTSWGRAPRPQAVQRDARPGGGRRRGSERSSTSASASSSATEDDRESPRRARSWDRPSTSRPSRSTSGGSTSAPTSTRWGSSATSASAAGCRSRGRRTWRRSSRTRASPCPRCPDRVPALAGARDRGGFVRRCLEKDPAARPQSMEEVLRGITECEQKPFGTTSLGGDEDGPLALPGHPGDAAHGRLGHRSPEPAGASVRRYGVAPHALGHAHAGTGPVAGARHRGCGAPRDGHRGLRGGTRENARPRRATGAVLPVATAVPSAQAVASSPLPAARPRRPWSSPTSRTPRRRSWPCPRPRPLLRSHTPSTLGSAARRGPPAPSPSKPPPDTDIKLQRWRTRAEGSVVVQCSSWRWRSAPASRTPPTTWPTRPTSSSSSAPRPTSKADFRGALEHFLASNRLVRQPQRRLQHRPHLRAARDVPRRVPLLHPRPGRARPTRRRATASRTAIQRIAPNVAVLNVETDPPGARSTSIAKTSASAAAARSASALGAGQLPRHRRARRLRGRREPCRWTAARRGDARDATRAHPRHGAGRGGRRRAGARRQRGRAGRLHRAVRAGRAARPPPALRRATGLPDGAAAHRRAAPDGRGGRPQVVPLTGTLVMNADERDAVIEVDGKAAGLHPGGAQPCRWARIACGSRSRGFAPVVRDVTITGDAVFPSDGRSSSPLTPGRRGVAPRVEDVADAPGSVTVIVLRSCAPCGYPTWPRRSAACAASTIAVRPRLRHRRLPRLRPPGDYGNRTLVLSTASP